MDKYNYSEVSNYLEDIGMPRSAQLSKIKVNISDENSNAYLFFREEIIRIIDFCELSMQRGLDMNTLTEQRELSLIVPILRTIVENAFKTQYIFKSIHQGKIDDEEINQDFRRICEVFAENYRKYSDRNKDDVLREIFFDEARNFDVSSVLRKVEESYKSSGADAGDYKNKQYKIYQYCCFYSHGNMNRGITNEVGDPKFNEYTVGSVLESISHTYLAYLCLLGSNKNETRAACEPFFPAR